MDWMESNKDPEADECREKYKYLEGCVPTNGTDGEEPRATNCSRWLGVFPVSSERVCETKSGQSRFFRQPRSAGFFLWKKKIRCNIRVQEIGAKLEAAFPKFSCSEFVSVVFFHQIFFWVFLADERKWFTGFQRRSEEFSLSLTSPRNRFRTSLSSIQIWYLPDDSLECHLSDFLSLSLSLFWKKGLYLTITILSISLALINLGLRREMLWLFISLAFGFFSFFFCFAALTKWQASLWWQMQTSILNYSG